MVRILQVLKYYENGELDILVNAIKTSDQSIRSKRQTVSCRHNINHKENIFNPNEGLKEVILIKSTIRQRCL